MPNASQLRRNLPIFAWTLSSLAISGLVAITQFGCQSKPPSKDAEVASSAATPPSGAMPGENTLAARDLEGPATTVDGTQTVARAIVSGGESRRPVAVDGDRLVFASRRIGLDRWQVFEALLKAGVERRVSFDAGNNEPVGLLSVGNSRRLIVATSTDAKKSSSRVLSEYRSRFSTKSPASDTRTSDSPYDASVQLERKLLLELPALGKRGTEWVPVGNATAQRWIASTDKDGKNAIILAFSEGEAPKPFRVGIGKAAKDPFDPWTLLNVERPDGFSSAAISDGRIFPDGSRAVWSNGQSLWTTALNGKQPEPLGDGTLNANGDLAIDPSGQWIVFSTATANRGLNLAALHRSGRCFRTLTEIPGDELDPAFSPDGLSLFFTQRQGDQAVVAQMAFATSTSGLSSCRD